MRKTNGLQAILLIFAMACPGVALAKGPDVLLQEAIVNIRMGQFSASIRLLKQADRKAKDTKLKAQIQLYLGLNYSIRKKWKIGRKAFKRALKLNPLLEVTDEVAKKSVVKLFREVRASLTGRLRVTADRPKVTVLLDGKPVGTTPHTASVTVGKHRLVLESADGLYRKELEVVVWEGKDHPLEAALEFRGSRLSVASEPAGARVFLDDKEAGVTPLKAVELTAGEHSLKLALAGYDDHLSALTLLAGKPLNMQINLAATSKEPRPAIQPLKLLIKPKGPSAVRSVGLKQTPIYKKWWFWTIVGAVVVGTTTTAVVATQVGGSDRLPSGDSGSIRLDR